MPIPDGSNWLWKTTLVRALIEPLGEVAADTDFKQIADERVIDMWLNFVLFVDEMGWSTKAEANLVKYKSSRRRHLIGGACSRTTPIVSHKTRP